MGLVPSWPTGILCVSASISSKQAGTLPWSAHLVSPIGEVHGDAEGQGVVERVPQQDGYHFHARWPGLPLPRLQGPLHCPLAVGGVLAGLISQKVKKEGTSKGHVELTPAAWLFQPGGDQITRPDCFVSRNLCTAGDWHGYYLQRPENLSKRVISWARETAQW